MTEDFTHKYSASQIIKFIKEKKDEFWLKKREENALALFASAAKRVPAYKDFLKKNRINPKKIKTWRDFQEVPPVDKKNYLRVYPLEKLSWDGSLKKTMVFTATSGSTGDPFYFPRYHQLDWESSIAHELFLQNNRLSLKGPTLIIIGFGMGVWIGGLITYKAFEIAGHRSDYPISILTAGVNKIEIFHALRKLAPNFKQTILIGYPPFIKDIIDESADQRIDLKKLNLRLLFAAESFTEKFRDYLVKKAGVRNLFIDTMNIYGSADIGTMAFETPAAILARRLAMTNKKMFEEFFTTVYKTPTLAQYNPFFITFEAPKNEILLTGNSATPLIRYSIGDNGGVLNFGAIIKIFKKYGINLEEEAKKAGISNYFYQLPFVYVYERKDFSTTIYGLQIYPEMIREVLMDKSLSRYFTGKFTMMTKYDKKQNQYLEMNIELRKNQKQENFLYKLTLEKIIRTLRFKSSEFRELSDYIKRPLIKIVFWSAEHPLYFKTGTKQIWVKK